MHSGEFEQGVNEWLCWYMQRREIGIEALGMLQVPVVDLVGVLEL